MCYLELVIQGASFVLYFYNKQIYNPLFFHQQNWNLFIVS